MFNGVEMFPNTGKTFIKVTPEEEIITRTILRGTCPICDTEIIVAIDDYNTDECSICDHYYGVEFTDDDKYELHFDGKREKGKK